MGPLDGLRVVELPSIGPAPFCGMLLADLGADVLRLERPGVIDLGVPVEPRFDLLNRGKKSIVLDLKRPEGVDFALDLIAQADVSLEGFRPGVAERLGLGPDICIARNPRLVYGRMTGWGQSGPLAKAAGHDINYIALTGALHAIGRKGEPPAPPLNLVGDFGGGALYLAVGVLAAILEARTSGRGQVIDSSMVDGASHLMMMFYGMLNAGAWRDERGVNFLDGAPHYYGVYETQDGRYVAIGAIEGRFHDELLTRLGIDPERVDQNDENSWPALKERLASVFRTKTRDEWCKVLEGTDSCFAPILSLTEAPRHFHTISRKTFIEVDGIVQPAPTPRFSRTNTTTPSPPPSPGRLGLDCLHRWEIDKRRIETLRAGEILRAE